tara:strand:+ start:122 stop:526 length:405 start_codon:yes stop_codon:yes gene_type:complete
MAKPKKLYAGAYNVPTHLGTSKQSKSKYDKKKVAPQYITKVNPPSPPGNLDKGYGNIYTPYQKKVSVPDFMYGKANQSKTGNVQQITEDTKYGGMQTNKNKKKKKSSDKTPRKHASQTQMRAARRSMGLGKYNW